MSQVERLYPRDYESILNASAAIVGMGLTPLISAKLAPVMGVDVRRLCDAKPDGAVAWTKERGFEELTRRDYLKDAALLRLADRNPRFEGWAGNGGMERGEKRV
jgi:hypothetical protein